MKLNIFTCGLLFWLFLHVAAQSDSMSYGASSDDKKICKKTYKDFISCALAADISTDVGDRSISFSDPSECADFYSADFQACYGGFWALYSAGDFGNGSPPAAVAGGVTKKGKVYASYSLPTYDTYDAKGVYPVRDLNCQVCGRFFKRLLECALPFDASEKDLTSALQECAGITQDENDEYIFTDDNDAFLASACGLLEGGYSSAPSEADASRQVSYALVTPFLSGVVSQQCPAMEAQSKKSGRVAVVFLKNNIIFNGGGGDGGDE